MIQTIQQTPTPPGLPGISDLSSFSSLVKAISNLYLWATKLNQFLSQILIQLAQNSNTGQSGFGADIASATSITVNAALHHVTGTAAIKTITPPPNFAGGPVWLVAGGAWSTITGGNIAAAFSAAVGQSYVLVYDPVKKLWYPNP